VIAALTVPDEPEPGVCCLCAAVGARYLMLSKPDDSAKADTENTKIVAGSNRAGVIR
jgi:hypothetical protein